MAEDLYFLTGKAIQNIRQIGLRVSKLEQSLGANKRVNQRTQQIYARIETSAGQSTYTATQVIADETTGLLEKVPTDKLTWGPGADDVGYLYAIDYKGGDASGVVPVWRYSDGTTGYWGFQWWDDYLLPFKRTIDGTDVSINQGKVFYGSETSTDGVSVLPSGTWDINIDRKFYVEITSTPEESDAEEVTVTATLQTTTDPWPKEWDMGSTGTLVQTKRIGEILNGEYIAYWENDIYVMYPLQPAFPEGYRVLSTDPTAGKFIAGDGTSISSTAGKDIIFDARALLFEGQGGGIRKIRDNSYPDIKIGGVGSNTSDDYLTEIDTDTENEITFNKSTRTLNTEYGLVQQIGLGADAGAAQITSKDWIKIEKGGQFIHTRPTREVTWVTLSYDGTNWTDGSISGPELDLEFDEQGHLENYAIDGTTVNPPEDQTNYKYQRCDDPTQTIVLPDQSFNSVRHNFYCWELVGETSDSTTTGSIGSGYADCSACEGDQTAYILRRCDNDASVALVPQSGWSGDDYQYTCLSSAWVKTYIGEATSGTTTTPSFWDQCDDDPEDCTALNGMPYSDSFGGVSNCDSTAVGDDNWDLKTWAIANLNADTFGAVVSGGKQTQTAAKAAGAGGQGGASMTVSIAGTFEVNSQWSQVSNTGTGNDCRAGIELDVGGTRNVRILWQNNMAVAGVPGFFGLANGSSEHISSSLSGTFKITRDGSNVVRVYIDSTLVHSGTVSGTLTKISIITHTDLGSTVNDYFDINVLDGIGGSKVYRDLEGLSCT